MASTPNDEAVGQRQWVNLVRRARLGRQTKAVALCLATYADANGGRIWPGVARLSFECEMSYSMVKRELAKLRSVGLVRKVGKKGDADIYQLIFSANLFENIAVPTPAQEDQVLEKIRKRVRGAHNPDAQKARRGKAAALDDEPQPGDGQEEAAAHVLSRSQGAEDEGCGSESADSEEAAAQYEQGCGSPRRAATTHELDTTANNHSDEGLHADVTVPRAEDGDEDPISPPADLVNRPRCPHGRSPRVDRGVPRCPDCRAPAAVPIPVAKPLSDAEQVVADARAKISAARLKYHPPRTQAADVRVSHSDAMAAIDAKLASYDDTTG